MLRIKGSAGHSRCTDLQALFMNNFEHRALRIELYKGVFVRVLNWHRDEKSYLVDENRGEMGSLLVTQDSTHRVFC